MASRMTQTGVLRGLAWTGTGQAAELASPAWVRPRAGVYGTSIHVEHHRTLDRLVVLT